MVEQQRPFQITLSIDHLINSYNLTKDEFNSFDKDGDDLLSQARESIAKKLEIKEYILTEN